MSDKKVALVTGASRGIGRAIAEQLIANGFFVVGTATTDKGAAAIGDALGENGSGKRLDVADKTSVDATLKTRSLPTSANNRASSSSGGGAKVGMSPS